MVQINFAQKSVNLKVVYYGPGMSGKTTNLEVIHQRAPEGNRGDLTSISTDGDRTLFFDYMPLDLGTVAGMRTAFQLYTVPGQVYYNSTRKLVLQGVDGIIFIADSSASMVNQNLESLRNLEENLNEYGKSLATLPHAIQLNKRDLPDAMPVEELGRLLNPHNAPMFEAIANTGQGVFPTLKALAASVLKNIMNESGQKAAAYQPPSAPAPHTGAPHARPSVPQRPNAPAPVRPTAPFPPAAHPPGPMHGLQPSYPHLSSPAPMAGGFYGGAPAAPPMGHGQPLHAPHAHAPGGMQLAQPGAYGTGTPHALSQTRSQPRPALSLTVAKPGAPPAPAPRPQRAATTQAPAAGKGRAHASKAKPAEPQKTSSGKFTPVLIMGGACLGAVLAWVLMNVL